MLAFDEPVSFAREMLRNIPLPPASGAAQLAALDAVNPARREELRELYIKSLLREIPGEPDARLLLDKNPSPTMSLRLWLRIFPELKVIIALRDPRDVLISCQLMVNRPQRQIVLEVFERAFHLANSRSAEAAWCGAVGLLVVTKRRPGLQGLVGNHRVIPAICPCPPAG